METNELGNLQQVDTPIMTNVDLHSDKEPIPNATDYRNIIGSLQYMVLTRPDIQFAVNQLTQFMAYSQPVHWTVVKHVLRYLAGTFRYGIIIHMMVDHNITAFCDVDWGGDTTDRKSRTGYLIYVDCTLVS